MCTLRVKTDKQNLTFLNVHAPTELKDDEIKEAFYSELERVYDSLPTSDVRIILGDFNAQIGKEQCFHSVAGFYSLHSISNDNGSRLAGFALSSGLMIRSTQFQRRDIYKVTWNSNDKKSRSQIDHVLIDKVFSTNISNVRSYRGTLHDSDHALVKIQYKCKWPRRNARKENGRPKFNIHRLNCDETKAQFETKVEQLLNNQNSSEDINQTVRQTTEAITTAAEEVLGKDIRSRKNNWFDEDCLAAVEAKKQARLRTLQRHTRGNEVDLKKKNIQVYRLLRKKKREKLNEEIENLESMNRNGNVRDFFKNVKQQRKGFQAKSIKIKDKEGQLLSDIEHIARRWKVYFHELLNQPVEAEQETTAYSFVEPLIETPSYDEVLAAINKLKNHKAPGEDNIPAELIKHGGVQLWTRLHQIIVMVWEEEKLPEEWLMRLLIPIHKKGSRSDCENYRGICLLNVSYKILAVILYDRLAVYTEEIIGGFRTGRSTTDQLFIIRQIMEKAWEYNISIHQLFVDFKQAYDSIRRNIIFNIMEEFGIPRKLIRLTKATLTATKCKIMIQGALSDPFDIDTGLRQGDRLSTILFNLALEKVIRAMSINWKGTIFTSSKQLTAFADDVDLLGRGTLAVKESFVEMQTAGKEIGLVVNEDKTKYLTLDRQQGSRIGQNITMNEFNFEVVQSFKYLGSIINVSNDIEEEIQIRTSQGNKCFYALRHLFKSSLLSRSTKFRLYRTMVRPIVMYGCETWTLTNRLENTLNVFERKMLRKICGPIQENNVWRARNNRELSELFGCETIVSAVKSSRLRWAGHVMRMDNDRAVKKTLNTNCNMIGNRTRGRPRKR